MKRFDSGEILLLAVVFVLVAAVFWILIDSFITREMPELVNRTPTPTVRTLTGPPPPDIFTIATPPVVLTRP